MNKDLKRILAGGLCLLLASGGSAFAQVKAKGPAKPAATSAPTPAAPAAEGASGVVAPQASADGTSQPPASEWISRCASEARQGGLECVVEQTAVLQKTGQLVAAVSIRVPADTHQPSLAVQIPVGLYLPAGVSLAIDDKKPLNLQLQTCDLKGCYAAMPISPELLGELKSGKKLAVSFQNLTKENITVPLQLANFEQAYQKIQ
ncbi:MAG: invasion associated locus B family protein [Hyphomicrobiales bacterium]|nr:invasion associated locus B family protein [Hyphomicrobiales bacterium]MBV9974170.1 invasion associated locus B family protein [Hyphomicrobiales bacterium]